VQIMAGPKSAFDRSGDGLALLYGYFPDPGITTLPSSPLSYPNPFPTTWGASVQVQLAALVPRLATGATTPRTYLSGVSVTSAIQSLPAQVAPVVSPPRNVQLNGMPFSTDRMGATRAPTVTWDAPTLGMPKRFLLRVEQLQVSSGRTTARVTAAFWLLPTDTSFTLPPNLLALGQAYVFTLTAYATSGNLTRDFGAFDLPVATANVISGVVRP
jgi:hypothetical protein